MVLPSYEVYAAIQQAKIILMIPRDGSFCFRRSVLTKSWDEVKQLIDSIPTRDFVIQGEDVRWMLDVGAGAASIGVDAG